MTREPVHQLSAEELGMIQSHMARGKRIPRAWVEHLIYTLVAERQIERENAEEAQKQIEHLRRELTDAVRVNAEELLAAAMRNARALEEGLRLERRAWRAKYTKGGRLKRRTRGRRGRVER